ncbi:MAG: hypothetical protein HYY86_01180 [Candidatus Harrisonbacteria bacterium]|nr:hypothetical protein [Candidatus Harrisonbacteria bacterium]
MSRKSSGWQLFKKDLERQTTFKARARKLGYENFFHVEVTPPIAAKVLACTIYNIRKAMADKKLPARKVGKFTLLHGHDLWVYYRCFL